MQRWPYDTGYQDIPKNKKNKKQIDYKRIMKFMRKLIGRKMERKRKKCGNKKNWKKMFVKEIRKKIRKQKNHHI